MPVVSVTPLPVMANSIRPVLAARPVEPRSMRCGACVGKEESWLGFQVGPTGAVRHLVEHMGAQELGQLSLFVSAGGKLSDGCLVGF